MKKSTDDNKALELMIHSRLTQAKVKVASENGVVNVDICWPHRQAMINDSAVPHFEFSFDKKTKIARFESLFNDKHDFRQTLTILGIFHELCAKYSMEKVEGYSITGDGTMFWLKVGGMHHNEGKKGPVFYQVHSMKDFIEDMPFEEIKARMEFDKVLRPEMNYTEQRFVREYALMEQYLAQAGQKNLWEFIDKGGLLARFFLQPMSMEFVVDLTDIETKKRFDKCMIYSRARN